MAAHTCVCNLGVKQPHLQTETGALSLQMVIIPCSAVKSHPDGSTRAEI